MQLREVLHAHLPLLAPESSVRDAIDKMDIYQFPALVVVDLDHRPVGVITEGDLSRAASRFDSIVKLADQPISAFMTPNPTVATQETEVSEALHLMLSSGLTVLPIAEDGRFLGLVLRVDLMQAILMDAAETSPSP